MKIILNPFLGEELFVFYLGPPRAEVSDVCLPLIETYKAVRKNHELERDEFGRIRFGIERSRCAAGSVGVGDQSEAAVR
jgi:hypothetical protein